MPDKTVNMYIVKRKFARDFADIEITKFSGEIIKNHFTYFVDRTGRKIDMSFRKMTSASDVIACETLEEANDVAFDAIDDAIERVSAAKVIAR